MSDSHFPADMKTIEDGLIRDRRIRSGAAPDGPRIGLALSGGGIRSATFCLGFLQALAARNVLRRFDYLSTVSGGGYIGSFLGKWINEEKDIGVVEDQLAKSQSKPVAFLRENGRFLAPNGTGDGVTAAAGYLRNWLTCTLVMGTLGLALFLFIEFLRACFFAETYCAPFLALGSVVLSPFCLWALAALALVDVPLVFAFWFPSKSVVRAWAPWTLVLVIAGLLVWHLRRRDDVRWVNLHDKEMLFAWVVGMTILAAARKPARGLAGQRLVGQLDAPEAHAISGLWAGGDRRPDAPRLGRLPRPYPVRDPFFGRALFRRARLAAGDPRGRFQSPAVDLGIHEEEGHRPRVHPSGRGRGDHCRPRGSRDPGVRRPLCGAEAAVRIPGE